MSSWVECPSRSRTMRVSRGRLPMIRRAVTTLAIAIVAVGCGATGGSGADSDAAAPTGSLTPIQLAMAACPPSDNEACAAEIDAAVRFGQPAAFCFGPQFDRWNITVPAAEDTIGSPCGPE